MKGKKYEIVGEVKVAWYSQPLKRIRALRDIPSYSIREGELGGLIESEDNLSQDGNAWVCGDACVYGRARVSEDARVLENARVSGDASVFENAEVSGMHVFWGMHGCLIRQV
ncbi:MAG: hypothetical protein QW040_03125 [Candidatus Aenigmatarchaeota archaeon]